MKRLTKFSEIGLGDILCDYIQPLQRRVHFLVVDEKEELCYINCHGQAWRKYYVLQPLDAENFPDQPLALEHIEKSISTWRKVA